MRPPDLPDLGSEAAAPDRTGRGGEGTLHGPPSTFPGRCGDRTETPREIAEEALAKKVGNAVEHACRRGDALETALNRWRAAGKCPPAVQLGEKRVAFVRAEVEAWIADRIAGRTQEAA